MNPGYQKLKLYVLYSSLVLSLVLLLPVIWFLYKPLSHNTNQKLILLGLDGADWEIIDHYIAEGELPTFKRLKQEATWGYLGSLEPTFSPMLWTTIATGKSPDEHGIVDFLEWDEEKKERLPITSHHRKVPAIWNMLSHHGLTVGIFNWLVSWPAEKVKGVLVSDRLGYHVFPRIIGPRLTLEEVSYPLEYAEKNKDLFVVPEKITYPQISEFIHISQDEFKILTQVDQYDELSPGSNLRLALATSETFKNFAFDYWKRAKPSFLALYLDIPDTVMHTFMDYAPPKLDRIPLEHFQKYKDAVKVTYKKIDAYIAELFSLMDKETHLMIVSDHGFKFGETRPVVSASIGKDNEIKWHDAQGILVLWGEHFQKGKQILSANLFDIVPTLLQFFNLPIAQDMTGKIISAAFRPEYFDLEKIHHVASYNHLRPSAQSKVHSTRSPEVDEATKEKLASLGYINKEEEKNKQGRYQTRNPFLEALQFEKVGNMDQALELYLKILKEDPKTEKALLIYNSLALIYRNKGDYPNAKKYIQKALFKEPTSSSLYINLGNIEKHFGYLDKAYQAYTRAMRINSKDGMAHYALALLYEEQKKWDLAEKLYQSALLLQLEMPSLPSQLLTTLEKQHKTAEFKKMNELFSSQKNPEKKFQFFISESQRYLNTNRFQAAMEALFEALRLQPKNAILYNDIGGIFLKQNNKTKAISYFMRGLELDPGYTNSYLNLASAYLEVNQPSEAKIYLQKAIKLEPKNKHAYYLLAVAQMKLMESKLAQYNFNKALKLDPTFSAAAEKLKELQKLNKKNF